MVEMEIDTSKMPLGRLSRSQLGKGFGALTEIQNILEDKVRHVRPRGRGKPGPGPGPGPRMDRFLTFGRAAVVGLKRPGSIREIVTVTSLTYPEGYWHDGDVVMTPLFGGLLVLVTPLPVTES
jgi:hypothetical protein